MVAGAALVGIGLWLLYTSSKSSYTARLGASLSAQPCGAVPEGLVLTTGRAAGIAQVMSPVLGLPCLISEAKVQVYRSGGGKSGWKPVHQGTQSVPFYVEDESGKVWVDPSEAEFSLLTDVEFSTHKRWKPRAGHLVKFGEMELTPALLRERLEQFYERKALAPGSRRKLRFTEKNLMAGDVVTVLGPAFTTPEGKPGAGEVRIHRIHPDDPFVIGEGDPQSLAVRMRQRVRWMRIASAGCMAAGAAMILDCFL